MNLKSKKNAAIYIQIAQNICDKILSEEYKAAEKIVSIREMAVNLEVNPNTVQRSYEWLQQREIIVTQRGKGYFVTEKAKETVMGLRKKQFIEQVLPEVFKNMQLLQMDISEVQGEYANYLKHRSNENK